MRKMRKKGSSSSSSFCDWAHLPPEMVELISEKVKSIIDYVRFRAVCYPWRSASLPKPRHLPPQLPWIMPPIVWEELLGTPPSAVFFDDVWEAMYRTFHLPGTEGRVNCACYRGWLLFAEYSGNEVFLINPLTRARIQLPPFAAPLICLGDDSDVPSDNSLSDYSRVYRHNFSGSKMTFSTDLTDPNCLITVLINACTGSRVICCRVGDPYWTRVDCCLGHRDRYYDVTYYNGRFFFLCAFAESMSIIDPNNLEERIVPLPGLKGVRKHFVEGLSGVYVLAISPEEKFELYQFLEQPMKLERITDTSNSIAIFYGDDYPCLAVCTDDWDSLDRVFAPMEHPFKIYACNCTVGSHYSIYSARHGGKDMKVNMMCGPAMLPLYRGCNVTWFQPSLI